MKVKRIELEGRDGRVAIERGNENRMEATPTPVEFYEAQIRPHGETIWFRLGGKTLEGARKAIALSRDSARITNRLIGPADGAPEYRIRHFVGTVTNLEA